MKTGSEEERRLRIGKIIFGATKREEFVCSCFADLIGRIYNMLMYIIFIETKTKKERVQEK
jgi:hypothetical protein